MFYIIGITLAMSCTALNKDKITIGEKSGNNSWLETNEVYWNPNVYVPNNEAHKDSNNTKHYISNNTKHYISNNKLEVDLSNCYGHSDNTFLNLLRLKNDIKTIKSHPLSWWESYEYDMPNDVVYRNVDTFISLTPTNNIFDKATIIPESNATLVIYWRTKSLIASVNIGDNDFSYVIYPLSDGNSKMDQASFDDRKAIDNFYTTLIGMI